MTSLMHLNKIMSLPTKQTRKLSKKKDQIKKYIIIIFNHNLKRAIMILIIAHCIQNMN